MVSKKVRIGLILLVAVGATGTGAWLLSAPRSQPVVESRPPSEQENAPAAIAFSPGNSSANVHRASTSRVGQRLTYQATFFLEAQGKGDAAPRTVITGNSRLSLSIVADNETDVELDALLSDISVTGDSEREGTEFAQKAAAAMKVPFVLHMTPKGQVSSIAFSPEGDEVGAGIMRGLASALQFTRPTAAGELPNAWTANESDNLGDYLAAYEKTGQSQYKKSASEYVRLELTKAFRVMQGQQGPSAHLQGTYELDDAGRLKVAKLTQSMSFPNDDGTASITSTYRLELKGIDRGGTRIAGSESWQRLPIGTALEVRHQRTTEKQNREVLAGGTWDSLRDDNLTAVEKGDDKARLQVGRRLTALFELEPKRAHDAVVALRNMRNPKEAQTLLGALTNAETPEALKAIQDAALDTRGNAEVREAALGHLGLHNQPTAETLKTLEKVATADPDPTLKKQAITSLGDAAGKIVANSEASPKDTAEAHKAIGGLTEQLKTAKDSETQTLYLQALGNAGGKDVFASTQALLQSPDPAVRQSAIFSLRNVAGDEADKLIVGALLRDEDPVIRGTAAQAAAFRRVSPMLLAGVAESLKTEQVPVVRTSLVESLSAFMTQAPSEVRPLLQALAKGDPDPRVREAAETLLKASAGA